MTVMWVVGLFVLANVAAEVNSHSTYASFALDVSCNFVTNRFSVANVGGSFRTGLSFEYAPAGQGPCTIAKNPRPVNIPNKPEPGTPRPAIGINYGYSEYDPNKELVCDFQFFEGVENAPQCTPAPPVVFPDVHGKSEDCLYLRTPADYKKALGADKSLTKPKCVIIENFVFEQDLKLSFKLPPKSFLGLRGMIVGYETSRLVKPPLFEWIAANGSTIAGDNAIVYVPGTAKYNAVQQLHSAKVFDVSQTSGLYINGITILQANAPFWHITADDTLLENVNVIAASPYPSNDRNADGFQVNGNNITIQKSFIQSGDDIIAVRRANGARFSCLQTVYGHALAIGGVSGGDVVQDIVFQDVNMVSPERALRVKADKFSTGLVNNVLYKNIRFFEANTSGIAIQQDYTDHPGPDGMPDSNVMFNGIHFENIQGTVRQREPKYVTTTYTILCSSGPKTKGGCKDLTFKNVKVTSADGKTYPPQFVNFDPSNTGIVGLTETDLKNVTKYIASGKLIPGQPATPNTAVGERSTKGSSSGSKGHNGGHHGQQSVAQRKRHHRAPLSV